MDDLLYESCLRYFTTLSNYGFKSEKDVKKLLFYVFIQELVNTTSIVISEEDYKHIENALYCMYGTTCLIPYPNYCESPMYAHLGDIAELSARMERAEETLVLQDVRITDIENTRVVKSEDSFILEDIEDDYVDPVPEPGVVGTE